MEEGDGRECLRQKGFPLSPGHSTRTLVQRARSQAGAFDLPSIITGVVVVGILTAGVLAAIFGIIPFAQDKAAKQDLAAINTAQGVGYAKDGQKYRDLDALNESGLIKLDPKKTEVFTGSSGKAFTAIVDSGSGKRWYITHDDTEPRLWVPGGNPGEPLSAVGFCTTPIVETFEESLSEYPSSVFLGWKRTIEGIPGYQAEFDAYYANASPLPVLTAEETGTFQQISIDGAAWPSDHLKWEAFAAEAAAEEREQYREACREFAGPIPYVAQHPSISSFGSYQGVLGSNDPILVQFTLAYGGADSFEFKASDSLPGYARTETRFEMRDGKPLWTAALHPVAEGWGYQGADAYSRSRGGNSNFWVMRKGEEPGNSVWGLNITLTSPAMAEHPSGEAWEKDAFGTVVLRGKSGSTDPIVFSYAVPSISKAEHLTLSRTNPPSPLTCPYPDIWSANTFVDACSIPGFSHGELKAHGTVEGKLYWTYTMWPGSAGWGPAGETYTSAVRGSGPMMDGTTVQLKIILE